MAKVNDISNMDSATKQNILDSFATASEKNQYVEVLKELFDVTKLKLITDLKSDHVSLITRMLVISDLKDIKEWKDGIDIFMQLRISKDRKSRKELISAIKGVMSEKRGIMDKVFGNNDDL